MTRPGAGGERWEPERVRSAQTTAKNIASGGRNNRRTLLRRCRSDLQSGRRGLGNAFDFGIIIGSYLPTDAAFSG